MEFYWDLLGAIVYNLFEAFSTSFLLFYSGHFSLVPDASLSVKKAVVGRQDG